MLLWRVRRAALPLTSWDAPPTIPVQDVGQVNLADKVQNVSVGTAGISLCHGTCGLLSDPSQPAEREGSSKRLSFLQMRSGMGGGMQQFVSPTGTRRERHLPTSALDACDCRFDCAVPPADGVRELG